MTFDVQCTARKRDPETGAAYRWRLGPYRELPAAERCARRIRRRPDYRRKVRVEVVVRGQRGRRSHAEGTRLGMRLARARGTRVGRPRLLKGELTRARNCVAAWSATHGKTEGLRIASRFMKVSVSTLERMLRRPSKGVT